MPHDRLNQALEAHVAELEDGSDRQGGRAHRHRVRPPTEERGARVLLEGQGDREFLRLNSNSYLGISFHPEIIRAEEEGSREFGAGPGAVRFISGSYGPHRRLEERLAAFHAREDAMVFSSAYAAVLGTLVPLITSDTVVISDELNHNCIINAMRLARPAEKVIFPTWTWRPWTGPSGNRPEGKAGRRGHRRDLLHAGRPRPPGPDHGDRPPARRRSTPRTWWSWWTTPTGWGPSGPRAAGWRSTSTRPRWTSWWAPWGRPSG
jgi:hypothetical protein